ncbi:MAG: integrase arm-type DNA-binding domain-containing protein [Gammaproteobacteria bacterium]|nr:integrase arm-type DNA-binding domain-containing protein [Gammaproteobacteria bacterium]
MKRRRLSAKAVEKQRRAGYFADGGGLYLQCSPTRAKSWIFRYTLRGRAREMGLGSTSTVSLAEARHRAQQARKLLGDGIDPIQHRNAHRAAQALDKARQITFGECAHKYIGAHRAGWRNAKHIYQWTYTIDTYCGPIIGALPVADVDTGLVLKVLEPIWETKTETASRLRARIENILDWATVRGYREGENPARWKGHLSKLLPPLRKRQRVKHHPALPYEQIGEFMQLLGAQEGAAARALEFTVLTAGRTGEVINAKPEEFDLDKALWTVPAARMKSGREHRVPLSPRAVKIVRAQLAQDTDHLFPGAREGKPLSNMAMLMLLKKRLGRGDLTVHGFRSSFRDWTAECTGYAREVCEMALAHTIGDQTEASYRRGDLFDKRIRLMTDWAKHCERPAKPTTVVKLKSAAR